MKSNPETHQPYVPTPQLGLKERIRDALELNNSGGGFPEDQASTIVTFLHTQSYSAINHYVHSYNGAAVIYPLYCNIASPSQTPSPARGKPLTGINLSQRPEALFYYEPQTLAPNSRQNTDPTLISQTKTAERAERAEKNYDDLSLKI